MNFKKIVAVGVLPFATACSMVLPNREKEEAVNPKVEFATQNSVSYLDSSIVKKTFLEGKVEIDAKAREPIVSKTVSYLDFVNVEFNKGKSKPDIRAMVFSQELGFEYDGVKGLERFSMMSVLPSQKLKFGEFEFEKGLVFSNIFVSNEGNGFAFQLLDTANYGRHDLADRAIFYNVSKDAAKNELKVEPFLELGGYFPEALEKALYEKEGQICLVFNEVVGKELEKNMNKVEKQVSYSSVNPMAYFGHISAKVNPIQPLALIPMLETQDHLLEISRQQLLQELAALH